MLTACVPWQMKAADDGFAEYQQAFMEKAQPMDFHDCMKGERSAEPVGCWGGRLRVMHRDFSALLCSLHFFWLMCIFLYPRGHIGAWARVIINVIVSGMLETCSSTILAL